MQLSLIGSRQLSDGFTSFNQSAQDALNVWSPYLAHMRCAGVSNSPIVPNENDEQMSVFFASNYFGQTFGSNTLAVTLLSYRPATIMGQTQVLMEETDTVFNTAFSWDSYRGPLRAEMDFHRVAIHELGYTLGLDNNYDYSQNVVAIMNSIISIIEKVTVDDIVGVMYY